MREFKVKYEHDKAREILTDLGAQFAKEEILEDFYLIDDGRNIYKLARVGGIIKIVHLINEEKGFTVVLNVKVDKQAQRGLSRFLDNNSQVMRKERTHYKWQGSEVVLDKIVSLGEFIELYPTNDKSKRYLFKIFNIQVRDLIKESYNSLQIKK